MDSNPFENVRFIVVDDQYKAKIHNLEIAVERYLEKDIAIIQEDFKDRLKYHLLESFEKGEQVVIFLDEALDWETRGTFMIGEILNEEPELKSLKGIVVCNSSSPEQQVKNFSDYKLLEGSSMVVDPGYAVKFVLHCKDDPERINELLNENLPNSETNVEYNNRN